MIASSSSSSSLRCSAWLASNPPHLVGCLSHLHALTPSATLNAFLSVFSSFLSGRDSNLVPDS